tara:strand:- start:86 stop:724 length:639 start_codon:yes stop_codon:yes gene_type:complete
MNNKIISGQVIPINQANIDTDAIIPKQYLKSINKSGFGKFLFDSLRYSRPGTLDDYEDREPNMDFILNKEPFNRGNILIANDNFGCGSSREHAVWAIKDFGIEAIISTSFADIFSRNSFKNGILLITVSKDVLEKIFKEIDISKDYILSIDVVNQSIIGPNNLMVQFEINESDKERIIHGYDDIAITLKRKSEIMEYEHAIKKIKPWLFNDE